MSLFDWLGSLFKRKVPPPSVPPQTPGDMLSLHNAERKRFGAQPLAADARLTAAALSHAVEMANSGWLTHEGFPGRVGVYYPGKTLAENIAAVGAGVSDRGVWLLWLNSPGHRANALAPAFRDVGFGSAVSRRDGQTYWCAIYGAGG